MVQEFRNTELGDISVDNEVIKNIALKAATDVNGVHELKGGYISSTWSKLIRRGSARGVKLEFQNASEARIILKLLVEYGVSIPYAAEEAQQNVKNVVEHMTGLNITEVVVNIMGMAEIKKKDMVPERIEELDNR